MCAGVAVMLAGCSSKPVDLSNGRGTGSQPIDINDLERKLDRQQAEQPPSKEDTGIPPVPQTPPSGDDNPSGQTPTMTGQKQYAAPPAMQIDKTRQYTAVLHTTDGDITIALDAQSVPITVNSFVFLAKDGFYDGTIFHRTIKGFMIQGGDPTGTGTGGPGYQFADEPFSGEYTRGTVAMANAGPDTNGSQFFIMHADYALPPNYVIFGHVTEGLETVDKIATAPTRPGGEGSSPVQPATVTGVDISER